MASPTPHASPVLIVVMDGIGARSHTYGNAVALADTPQLWSLVREPLYRTIFAHGKHVGLPEDSDMGNSEVGHNALGAGQIIDQGAKLVQKSIENGSIFHGSAWLNICSQLRQGGGTLHLIGLLSDGNVHSHEQHLFALLRQAKLDGIARVRIHALLDGRDVGERSAEIYAERLDSILAELNDASFSALVASGGGRMTTTMDRYNSDWSIVARGWKAHVLGQAPHRFSSLREAIGFFRNDKKLGDQFIPPFIIRDHQGPIGTINDGDAVILFNFRGDRAIQISRAFTENGLTEFMQERFPAIYYAGMMQYDGDLLLPRNFLVAPPKITGTLGEHLAGLGLRQFACSETQKYGHVTHFWNGNRSGKFSPALEEYLEIPSDRCPFEQRPWMKAWEITEALLTRIHAKSFDFARINFPNGDMVGHTGDLEATAIAVATVDLMLGRIMEACAATKTCLIVTADHGNAEEMFDTKKDEGPPGWLHLPLSNRPKPKTSHTLNPVPFAIFAPHLNGQLRLDQNPMGGLPNVANSILTLMGLPTQTMYRPSLVERV